MPQSVASLSPAKYATAKTKTPLRASRASVAMPSFLANDGFVSLTTLKTFVAPILPEPAVLMFTPAYFLAKSRPKGIPPIK